MPTPTKGSRLGGSAAHERLMLANMATSLFEHDRITTTEAKAKRLRPLAEKLITFAKRGDLHARRQVMAVIRDKDVVHKLFAEIGPKFAERPGGYTRIIKTNPRKGDNAPMAVIELVPEALSAKQSVVKEAERSRGTKTAAKSAPTGRTKEIAEDAKAESATAASVAAEAAEAEAAEAEAAEAEAAEADADAAEGEGEATDEVSAETTPTETTPTEQAEGAADETDAKDESAPAGADD